jgi:hypothetical protein
MDAESKKSLTSSAVCLGEAGPLSQGGSSGYEGARNTPYKRYGGAWEEAQGAQVRPLNPLSVAPRRVPGSVAAAPLRSAERIVPRERVVLVVETRDRADFSAARHPRHRPRCLQTVAASHQARDQGLVVEPVRAEI